MTITYLGHSCFYLETESVRLLFDPFIRPNPMASHINVSAILPTHIALSHAHGDHIADAAEIANQSGAKLIANYEITSWFENKGVTKTVGMNTGGTLRDGSLKLTLTQALHSSSFPDGSYGGNPNGFVVELDRNSIYFAGDTDLFSDMKLIAEWHRPELAILPIGDHFTMGYEKAAQAAEWLGVRSAIGMHYDTFPPIQIDHEKAKAAFAARGVTLHLLSVGASMTI